MPKCEVCGNDNGEEQRALDGRLLAVVCEKCEEKKRRAREKKLHPLGIVGEE